MIKNKFEFHVENVSQVEKIPSESDLKLWVDAALLNDADDISIRVVDEAESAALNLQFRDKQGPTNVLAFPYENEDNKVSGDIVICAALVENDQQWPHLTVHATLHLQGYDHYKDEEAETMETLEAEILSKLGYSNPYE